MNAASLATARRNPFLSTKRRMRRVLLTLIRLFGCGVLFVVLCFSMPMSRAEAPAEATAELETEGTKTATAVDPADKTMGSKIPVPAEFQKEKKRKAFAGLAALSAIAILGVGAIAATMVWARRLRRLARDKGPHQTTIGNDFWFFKPPKITDGKSDPVKTIRNLPESDSSSNTKAPE